MCEERGQCTTQRRSYHVLRVHVNVEHHLCTRNDSEPYLALFKTNFVPVRLSFAQDQCQYGYEMELNIFIEISWVRDLLCPI